MVFVVSTVSKMMFCPEAARIPAQMIPGIRNMARMIERDLVLGTSFIVDIISISSEEYVIKPYTKNSMMEISLMPRLFLTSILISGLF